MNQASNWIDRVEIKQSKRDGDLWFVLIGQRVLGRFDRLKSAVLMKLRLNAEFRRRNGGGS